jgi:hypothetical protein
MDPHTRPTFPATLKHLEVILIDFPQRPDIPLEPLPGENPIESYTRDDISINSNNWSSSTSSSSSSLLSPSYGLKDEHSHRHRSNSENKRRISWISGRYKLFHSATDDLLKNTPAKLMGFFKNVLGVRSKDLNIHIKGRKTPKDNDPGSSHQRRRSQSSSVLTRVSPLPTKDISTFNYDLNENKTDRFTTNQHRSEIDGNPSKSFSCPGTPGLSGARHRPASRRHTISPTTYSNTAISDFSISAGNPLYVESSPCSAHSDLVSMSSGFDSMPDSSSICTSNNECTSFTESDFSSRTSSLRRQLSLTEDEEDKDGTPTCKNIKAPHFDRYGSYSVINAETSSRLALVKDMEKDKMEGLKSPSSDNVKAKKRIRSPMLFSFLLGNRGKSKDT